MNPVAPTPNTARRVTITDPDGRSQDYHLTGDDTILIAVDGIPILRLDTHQPGPGAVPDRTRHPLDWHTRLIDHTVTIEGITTEALWHDLEAALVLPRHHLGRFKLWAADRPKIFSNTYDLDTAVSWAISHSLPYTDERAIHHEPNPTTCTGQRPTES